MFSNKMSQTFPVVVLLALGVGACTNTESATNLNPNGPPMIEQVRMWERFTDATGTTSTQRVFAFGNLPPIPPDYAPVLEHPVTSAVAAGPPAQSLRIIMDQLLLGNYLEEVQCRGVVDTDAFSFVPVGDTPDDIARCCVASDALTETCPGSNPKSICICKLEAGCGGVAFGDPVGILDVNQDGAADNTSFIEGAVGIQCGDPSNPINVPIDRDNSYWNPSGNQQVPAMGGFDALGPAIVLTPLGIGTPPNGALPTNVTCGLTFSSNVVNDANVQVCAPAGGRPADCTGNLDEFEVSGTLGYCPQTCTPGDVSAFTFTVEPLSITVQGINNGDVGINRTDDVIAQANSPLDPTSLSELQVFENGVPYNQFVVTLPMPTTPHITWTNPTGLDANSMYTITFPITVTDSYGEGLPAAVTINFTTGM